MSKKNKKSSKKQSHMRRNAAIGIVVLSAGAFAAAKALEKVA